MERDLNYGNITPKGGKFILEVLKVQGHMKMDEYNIYRLTNAGKQAEIHGLIVEGCCLIDY